MDEVKIWEQTLGAAMNLPFVKVNREEFLKKEISAILSFEKAQSAINSDPTKVLNKSQIDKIANGCIKYHLTTVSCVSALAGLPGGWALAGTIPADLAQFYGHVLCLAQKLLYLYGFPSLEDNGNKLTDESLHILTLSVGLMMGCEAAEHGIKAVLSQLAKGVTKQMTKLAITKTTFFQTCKTVAKWIGIKLTKDAFIKGTGKVIPLIGAPISGTLTYFTFRPMAYKLKRYLDGIYRENTSNM